MSGVQGGPAQTQECSQLGYRCAGASMDLAVMSCVDVRLKLELDQGRNRLNNPMFKMILFAQPKVNFTGSRYCITETLRLPWLRSRIR